MRPGIGHIILRSILHNRRRHLVYMVIILLLAVVISGSLLTGYSVRSSLTFTSLAKLNGTTHLISSGNRFMSPSLVGRFNAVSQLESRGMLAGKGWIKNFSTGESVLNIDIYGIDSSFFSFNPADSIITIPEDGALLNRQLANRLGVSLGDQVVLRTTSLSSIPPDSPFAPGEGNSESLFLTVAGITDGAGYDNFSLALTQVAPLNIFINRRALLPADEPKDKINRIIIPAGNSAETDSVEQWLRKSFRPEDAGFSVRRATNGVTEIISDRIFITGLESEAITDAIEGSAPVLTWLANSIILPGGSAPYSFISALPGSLYPDMPSESGILLTRWLADDTGAEIGDTAHIKYYITGDNGELEEREAGFTVEGIVPTIPAFGGSYLMPEFPGISGASSCRSWDAGVPVDFSLVREKDEEYWTEYRGAPRAYISYEAGKRLFGNVFGPATAIHLPRGADADGFMESAGMDPLRTGITVIPVREQALSGAQNSVDFSMLFISLSFFLIIAAVILLTLVISGELRSRNREIATYRALGFSQNTILRLILSEYLILSAGAVALSLPGIYLYNHLVIDMLNSVWKGAVQTSALTARFSFSNALPGLISTFLAALVISFGSIRRALRSTVREIRAGKVRKPGRLTLYLSIAFAILSAAVIALAIAGKGAATITWFLAGVLLFATAITAVLAVINHTGTIGDSRAPGMHLSTLEWARSEPGMAITPMLFVAAGIFIVVITGANRKSFDLSSFGRSSGTGGYSLWVETSTPVDGDLLAEVEELLIRDGEGEFSLVPMKRVDGDDASCLNLNQVSTPPLLGTDTRVFSREGAFSFASRAELAGDSDPWELLSGDAGEGTIYGIADQTILDWNLMIKAGDTLVYRNETGDSLDVIIIAGLNTSIFQGHIITGIGNLTGQFPSANGYPLMLIGCPENRADATREELLSLLEPYGTEITSTSARLAGFNIVTNTYLDVFMTLGGLGMIIGIAGLSFVIARQFRYRRREYLLRFTTGTPPSTIGWSVALEHLVLLAAAVLTGVVSGLVATISSLVSASSVPVGLLALLIAGVFLSGSLAIAITTKSLVRRQGLLQLLKEDLD